MFKAIVEVAQKAKEVFRDPYYGVYDTLLLGRSVRRINGIGRTGLTKIWPSDTTEVVTNSRIA